MDASFSYRLPSFVTENNHNAKGFRENFWQFGLFFVFLQHEIKKESIIYYKTMLNYPIGVQDFATIRERGFVYVDKTELVYKLTRGHVYFLGSPRRFAHFLEGASPSSASVPRSAARPAPLRSGRLIHKKWL
jgi:hypothetical protein